MKNRPSLLDIELFAEKRSEEKQEALKQIEAESDAAVFESLTKESSPRELESPPTSPVQDERIGNLIEVCDHQQKEIDKLKQDLFKVKEQLRVYHSFLSSQQKKIAELEKKPSNKPGKNRGVTDPNYIKLLLKNVVWLKEERDFSSNDVSRLFRAEGFEIPAPYEQWDADMIDILYHEAKKSFL